MNTCLKYLFVVINILFLIIGSLCVAFVFWTKAIKLIDSALDEIHLSDPLFYFGVCLGGLLIVLGLCGALGTCSKSKLLLGIYLGIVIFFVICEVAAVVYSVLKKDDLLESLGQVWNSTLGDDVKEDIQRAFNCCGYSNSSDWNVPPDSCYQNQISGESPSMNTTANDTTPENATNGDLWEESCSEAVLNWISNNVLFLIGALAATLLFQVFQIIVTALLIRAIIVPSQVDNQQIRPNVSKQRNEPIAAPHGRQSAAYSNTSFIENTFYDDSRGRGMQIRKQPRQTKVNNQNW